MDGDNLQCIEKWCTHQLPGVLQPLLWAKGWNSQSEMVTLAFVARSYIYPDRDLGLAGSPRKETEILQQEQSSFFQSSLKKKLLRSIIPKPFGNSKWEEASWAIPHDTPVVTIPRKVDPSEKSKRM